MKFIKFLFFCFLLLQILTGCDSTTSIEDPNKSHFLKFYGHDGDQTGDDMVVLPDGSFILFGTTKPSGGGTLTQWYLVKADANGNVIWEKRFGKPKLDEEANDIELTNDSRLVAVGNTFNTPTERDVRIMTFTLDGVPLDSAQLAVRDINGNLTTADEDALSVTQTNDGFIIAGSTTYLFPKPPILGLTDVRDALKIRLFNNLTVYPNSWVQTYGNYSDDVSQKIYQLANGSFHVFAFTNATPLSNPNINYNFWVFPISATGDPTTQQLFPGTPNDNEKLSAVCLAPLQSGSGYFLSGITSNVSGVSDIYVAKLRDALSFDPTDYQFQKPLSIKLGNGIPERTAVFASRQSGFYVLSNERNFNDNQNWILTKVSNDGSNAWNLPIVFGGEGLDACGAIQELPDGRIVLIGTMRTGKPDVGEFKMTLVKVSADGKFE